MAPATEHGFFGSARRQSTRSVKNSGLCPLAVMTHGTRMLMASATALDQALFTGLRAQKTLARV